MTAVAIGKVMRTTQTRCFDRKNVGPVESACKQLLECIQSDGKALYLDLKRGDGFETLSRRGRSQRRRGSSDAGDIS